MKFAKVKETEIDMKSYKAQTIVRRTSTSSLNYKNIAIMTDADVDG
ncbi:DNA topoisomerase II small subunit [Salmonella phage vB_SenM-AKM_NP4]|uniref:DNA topoisomerase II large subunit C-terminal region n=1 Tax=Salmonella phage S16 TaxID=1087482 RepID=M1HEW8_BPS16|nr:DNA topoisomerase II [Salmonella phage vB_SenM-S16]UFK27131.1 hypothetical protein LG358_00110 [Escherichia phage UoN_LG358_1]WDR21674.1 hypothetical protein PJM34_0006 [Salmonella phage vB_SenM_UTK0003]WKV23354.1 DNA topoisomerase small subunit [Salmonella phage SEA1]WLI71633.1 DNA topoisomerase II small subunit [Salmonella phage vB_SenM-AKM_NP4]AGE48138.1 DNA topoisomerase II large subunit C-terminal region [Salmonella phage vB_SenM-S16]